MKDSYSSIASSVSMMDRPQVENFVKKLLRTNHVLTEALDKSQTGVIITGHDGSIIYANAKAVQILPFRSKTRYRYLPVWSCIMDKDISAYLKNCILRKSGDNNGDNNNEPCEKEFNIQFGSEVRIIYVSIDAADNSEAVIISFTDVTEDRKRELNMRHSASLATMSQAAGNFAHGIKNPLASFSLRLQILQRMLETRGTLKKEDVEDSLRVMTEEVDRLSSVVNSFLYALRPVDVVPRIGDITECVHSVVEFVKPEADKAGCRLTEEIAASLPRVMFDAVAMKEVLLNLVQNALQALEGRKDGVVIVSVKPDGDFVRISVTDNGPGISQQDFEKIFQPYYTTKTRGTGLGLPLVYKIVREHNGEVACESRPNEGAVFTVSLPVPPQERVQIDSDSDILTSAEGVEK